MNIPYNQLGILAVVHLIAVASPGPDFALISRCALTESRRSALRAALGLTLGVAFHLGWVFFGLVQLGSLTPALLHWVKIFGALYLAFLGCKALLAGFWKNSARSDDLTNGCSTPSFQHAVSAGILTNLLNPKAIVYFMSLSAQFVTADVGINLRLAFAGEILMITFAWFAVLSYVFGMQPLRRRIPRLVPFINGTCGLVFLAFSGHLLLSIVG